MWFVVPASQLENISTDLRLENQMVGRYSLVVSVVFFSVSLHRQNYESAVRVMCCGYIIIHFYYYCVVITDYVICAEQKRGNRHWRMVRRGGRINGHGEKYRAGEPNTPSRRRLRCAGNTTAVQVAYPLKNRTSP